LKVELEESRLFEIGGPDRVAYADLMREYARQVGLRRAVIRVPFATPRISGLWLSVVMPVYANIGRGLIVTPVRVGAEAEEGLDASMHGESAYALGV
jgi:uncharacterized protein YbjT (DUF2867 family)